MSRRNLFLDFDGTLIDPRRRLYNLFQELTPQSQLTFDQYWEIKRRRVNQQAMLGGMFGFDDCAIAEFKVEWLRRVEEPERLALDRPFPGVGAFLERMSASNEIYLVTARQNPDRARQQVENFGWRRYFTDLLVTRQSESKAEIVRRHVTVSPADLLVGDTGEDIKAGKALGVQTAAVLTGFLNREILEEYAADRIFESVTEID